MSTLWLVATPIGNLEDITLRALRILSEVDALACEDTRVTRRIFARHGGKAPPEIFSCHEHNERSASERIIRLLAAGKTVALCTDAGMPTISDPGFRLVAEVLEAGFSVGIAPGPSAVETALALSGLPTSSYLFKGFPPRKPGRLRAFLAAERDRPPTMVFFESPYRLGRFLAAALETLGDRRAAVCLEMTKKFERVERGLLSRLTASLAAQKIKGEATVVIEGCRRPSTAEEVFGEAERP